MSVVAGCGQDLSSLFATRFLIASQCGGELQADQVATDLVILKWKGGVTSLYPEQEFAPLDLAVFPMTEGGTLADRADDFRDEVLQQIRNIYCDDPDIHIRIEHAENAPPQIATRVYFAQEVSPTHFGLIGEGHYDPCNQRHEDTAVLFAEQIRRLGSSFTFDEWVLMFANTAAHEIGHTLGFAHVDRLNNPQPQRSLYVELMLNRHTISELIREQRYVEELTNCPDNDLRSRTLATESTIRCSYDENDYQE